MNKMLFANKIRTLREQNGLLQRKIAAALNLAVQLVVVRYLDTLDDTFRCRYCQSLH